MKIIRFEFISLAMILSLFCSCGSKNNERPNKSPRIKKTVSIVSPAANTKIGIGDTLQIKLKSNKDAIKIDSIEIKIGNLPKSTSFGPTEKILLSSQAVGTKTIGIVAFLNNGTKLQLRRNITVLSDVVPTNYTFRKVNTFIHDPDDYTQGLVIDNGIMYENTGHYGESTLKKLSWETGRVLQSLDLDSQYFGEGIAIIGEKLYQLTWQEREGFVYDKKTLEQIGSFSYSEKGWGLTAKDDTLIMSDGSKYIYFRDTVAFQELKRIQVYDDKSSIDGLNELEFIDGKIWANRIETDLIYIIDPDTGKVEGVLDLEDIFNRQNYDRRVDVLNGIAYDKDTKKYYVTGKWWPKLYEIEIIEKPSNNS